jgi:hypothetical protein
MAGLLTNSRLLTLWPLDLTRLGRSRRMMFVLFGFFLFLPRFRLICRW